MQVVKGQGMHHVLYQYNTPHSVQFNSIISIQCNAMQCNVMQCNALHPNSIQIITVQKKKGMCPFYDMVTRQEARSHTMFRIGSIFLVLPTPDSPLGVMRLVVWRRVRTDLANIADSDTTKSILKG